MTPGFGRSMETAMTRRGDIEDRAAQREAFAAALFHVMDLKGVTHRQLGEALGLSHTVFSGWRSGDHEPAPWTVFKVEKALDLPPGFLSIHLGYVPPEARSSIFPVESFEALLDADANLDDRAKRLLKTMYAELRTPQPRRRRA
jgi:transcriptional regulator with XRE-family HTH domain